MLRHDVWCQGEAALVLDATTLCTAEAPRSAWITLKCRHLKHLGWSGHPKPKQHPHFEKSFWGRLLISFGHFWLGSFVFLNMRKVFTSADSGVEWWPQVVNSSWAAEQRWAAQKFRGQLRRVEWLPLRQWELMDMEADAAKMGRANKSSCWSCFFHAALLTQMTRRPPVGCQQPGASGADSEIGWGGTPAKRGTKLVLCGFELPLLIWRWSTPTKIVGMILRSCFWGQVTNL